MAIDRRGLLTIGGSFVCGSFVTGVSSGLAGYNMGESEGRKEGYQDGIDTGLRRAGGIEPSTNDTKIRSENREVMVESDDYHAINLTFAEETLFVYSVVADGSLDIVFMSSEDHEEYQNDGDPEYMVMNSDLDTSRAIRKEVIQSGEYALVLDNTTYGRANPEGPVEVGYSVEAYQRDG